MFSKNSRSGHWEKGEMRKRFICYSRAKVDSGSDKRKGRKKTKEKKERVIPKMAVLKKSNQKKIECLCMLCVCVCLCVFVCMCVCVYVCVCVCV